MQYLLRLVLERQEKVERTDIVYLSHFSWWEGSQLSIIMDDKWDRHEEKGEQPNQFDAEDVPWVGAEMIKQIWTLGFAREEHVIAAGEMIEKDEQPNIDVQSCKNKRNVF